MQSRICEDLDVDCTYWGSPFPKTEQQCKQAYDKLMAHNDCTIDALDDEQFADAKVMMRLCRGGTLRTLNEETPWMKFAAAGFVWNMKGDIVLSCVDM